MSSLETERRLEQRYELLEVAAILVVVDQVLELVGVHDYVEAAHLRQAELAVLDAREAHLLPRLGAVGLARALHRALVVLHVAESDGELGVVAHVVVEYLGGVEHAALVAAVADEQYLRVVGSADELLELGETVGLGVGVDELGLDEGLARLLARHLQVLDELLPVATRARHVHHLHVESGIVGLDERVDGLLDEAGAQLRRRQQAPHGRLVAALGELVGAVQILHVVDEHLDGRGVDLELAKDGERLLVQLAADGDVGDVGRVVVVQAVDVLHDARAIGLNGREYEQVLQVAVVAEHAVVEHDLLEHLDELRAQVGRHERLDRHADVLRVLGLVERRLHDLVDELAPVLVVLAQHERPEFGVATPHQVARLALEQAVLVAHAYELLVALAALVGDAGQVRIALLAVLADDARVVVGVLLEELLRVVVRVDVDLGQGVVDGRIGAALVNARLEPGQEELHAVALLDLLDELVDDEGAAHAHDHLLDLVLGAVDVQQAADDDRQAARIDLLHVDLDVLDERVAVQVEDEVVHEVEAIADDDERQLIGELGLLEEVLDALGVEAVALAAYALDLLDLARLARRLYVLEVHVGLLAEVDYGAEEVEEALVALERLEYVDERLRGQLLVILDGDLHAYLQVLTDVRLEHGLEALERVLDAQRAEVVDEPLGVEQVGVHHRALDVVHVRVVLEGALQQAGLLAQLSDVRPIVVREHLIGEYGVGHLRRRHQIHLEHARLQVALRLAVVLQRVEQKRRALLHQIVLHEHVDDLVEVRQRLGLVDQQLSELLAVVGIHAHDAAQQEDVVGREVHLLRVQDDLLVLARLHEALHDLERHDGAQVHAERERRVDGLDEVAELLARLQLLLLEPLLEQLLLALLNHGLAQLDRLVLVQLALVEQNAEVLEEWRGRARLCGYLFIIIIGNNNNNKHLVSNYNNRHSMVYGFVHTWVKR